MSEAEFWPLTPYRLGLILRARARSRFEAALYGGWFSERFAREPSLSGPQHYVRQFLEQEAAAQDVEALADAEFNRIARMFGSEIVEIVP